MSVPPDPPERTVFYENRDYYMSLSCKPGAIISLLCGTFWEPGVPCNLASPWLHPFPRPFSVLYLTDGLTDPEIPLVQSKLPFGWSPAF